MCVLELCEHKQTEAETKHASGYNQASNMRLLVRGSGCMWVRLNREAMKTVYEGTKGEYKRVRRALLDVKIKEQKV